MQPNNPTPAKKKKTPLLILLGLFLLGLIVAIVFSTVQHTRANEASAGYIEKTVDYLYAIGTNTGDQKERIETFRQRVELPDVALGSFFSRQYREAEEVETRYNALLDESTQFFEEFYTLSALAPIMQELTATVLTTIPEDADPNTRADLIMKRAETLDDLAARLDYCYFSDEYKAIKTTAVENIRKMSTASKATAEQLRSGDSDSSGSSIRALQNEYIDAYGKAREALQQAPEYGNKIAAYIDDNDEILNDKLNAYVEEYGKSNQ
jgi:hypothetical protein